MALLGYASCPARAHAFGERFDLPLPLSFYLVGAGGAVVLSFMVMALVLRFSPRAFNKWRFTLTRFFPVAILKHSAVTGIIQSISIGLFILIISAGIFGENNTLQNIAPIFVWVIWWVGFAYVSALIGNFWPVVNPWRIVFVVCEKAAYFFGMKSKIGFGLTYPSWLGVWPATILLGIFAWLELIYDEATLPETMVNIIIAYSVITWLGMATFGRDHWLSKGEPFSIIFEIFGRFAPIGRVSNNGSHDESSEWYLRPYASDLIVDRPCDLSMTIFVLLMLSTVTFDGFQETPHWTVLLQWGATEPSLNHLRLILHDIGIDFFDAFSTLILLLFPVLFFIIYMVTCLIATKTSEYDRTYQEVVGLFIYSLVPIAVAYHLAHYLSYLLVSGQFIIPMFSDPYGFGWNLFGTASYKTNIGVVGAKFVWYTAVIAIVVGHVFAVGVAHIIALRTFKTDKLALRSQYPILVLMVAYTALSLWIFSQPVLESPSYKEIREPSGLLSLAPQAIAETCIDMREGELIGYDFKSDSPVVFNIHFHDGFNQQFPVQLERISNHMNRFAAEIDQYYCLLWLNPGDVSTILTYEIVRF